MPANENSGFGMAWTIQGNDEIGQTINKEYTNQYKNLNCVAYMFFSLCLLLTMTLMKYHHFPYNLTWVHQTFKMQLSDPADSDNLYVLQNSTK